MPRTTTRSTRRFCFRQLDSGGLFVASIGQTCFAFATCQRGSQMVRVSRGDSEPTLFFFSREFWWGSLIALALFEVGLMIQANWFTAETGLYVGNYILVASMAVVFVVSSFKRFRLRRWIFLAVGTPLLLMFLNSVQTILLLRKLGEVRREPKVQTASALNAFGEQHTRASDNSASVSSLRSSSSNIPTCGGGITDPKDGSDVSIERRGACENEGEGELTVRGTPPTDYQWFVIVTGTSGDGFVKGTKYPQWNVRSSGNSAFPGKVCLAGSWGKSGLGFIACKSRRDIQAVASQREGFQAVPESCCVSPATTVKRVKGPFDKELQ